MADILLAIDIQHEASWRTALPEAVAQARNKEATLQVCAVVPDFGMSIVGQYFPADFEKDALRKAGEELQAFCQANIPEGVDWSAHLGHGDIDKEILRLAEELKVSLIVMSSHQPSELRSLLVGSHAAHVVNHAPVSVLVVR
ncbi:MAG TPA: universal stress protein [Kiloniellaceae bacterium]|nr:universal stress protein [Kiloniellaceae bacterium]